MAGITVHPLPNDIRHSRESFQGPSDEENTRGLHQEPSGRRNAISEGMLSLWLYIYTYAGAEGVRGKWGQLTPLKKYTISPQKKITLLPHWKKNTLL